MLMVDAASTIIFLPSAAVPDNSAAIAGSRGSPGLLPLTMIVVPGRVVIWADPFRLYSREDADGIASLYVDRAAAVDYRCVARLSRRPRLGEQAEEQVIRVDPTRRHVPRSIDVGVSVQRLSLDDGRIRAARPQVERK